VIDAWRLSIDRDQLQIGECFPRDEEHAVPMTDDRVVTKAKAQRHTVVLRLRLL
jgi:hypothetical protein